MFSLSCFFSFSGQIRKKVKSDLDCVITCKGEGDTAGGSSRQNADRNGRSALSEKRTLITSFYVKLNVRGYELTAII
ncbi:hypothetical protein SG79_15845 [Enterobacter hormaechei subsp. xiangfangensis]|nr:hypothetical protein SG79_15845 [Enterobacter hormaechei subsp. xiangfangensis]